LTISSLSIGGFLLSPIRLRGGRFRPDAILLAVRWYLRYGLSYRDVEELLAERGVDVDHVTMIPA
jgi:transposase-like protein